MVVTACTGCDWTTEAINAEGEDEHASHVAEKVAETLQLDTHIIVPLEWLQRGLALGEQFRTPLAAGARSALREAAGMVKYPDPKDFE